MSNLKQHWYGAGQAEFLHTGCLCNACYTHHCTLLLWLLARLPRHTIALLLRSINTHISNALQQVKKNTTQDEFHWMCSCATKSMDLDAGHTCMYELRHVSVQKPSQANPPDQDDGGASVDGGRETLGCHTNSKNTLQSNCMQALFSVDSRLAHWISFP